MCPFPLLDPSCCFHLIISSMFSVSAAITLERLSHLPFWPSTGVIGNGILILFLLVCFMHIVFGIVFDVVRAYFVLPFTSRSHLMVTPRRSEDTHWQASIIPLAVDQSG